MFIQNNTGTGNCILSGLQRKIVNFSVSHQINLRFRHEGYIGSAVARCKNIPQETVIYLGIVLVLLPWLFLAVRETVYLPFLVYVWIGFLTAEKAPSPKAQLHEVGDPVLLSVNVTLRGTFPEVREAEKSATGGFKAFTVM